MMETGALLQGLAEMSSRCITRDRTDYMGADGLLYCGQCHTPKQATIAINGIHPMCMCACAVARMEAEEEARRRADRAMRIKEARITGFPDGEMAGWTFDRDDGADKRMSMIAHRYVDNFEEMARKRKGLLLYGPVGTGKTFLAACIANALIDLGRTCLVTNLTRLTNEMQARFDARQSYIDSLNMFDLVVIDDFGVERNTDYMAEAVMSIIDARYRSGKPMIVTTNLSLDEMVKATDVRRQRTCSRILEITIPVRVDGKDRRMSILKRGYGDAAALLGL